jgi:hypothetical protein
MINRVIAHEGHHIQSTSLTKRVTAQPLPVIRVVVTITVVIQLYFRVVIFGLEEEWALICRRTPFVDKDAKWTVLIFGYDLV